MKRNAKLHEALARLAGKIEYGELMAGTQPAAFIDAVVGRLDELEAKLREAEERAEAARAEAQHSEAALEQMRHAHVRELEGRETAERERDAARKALRVASEALHHRFHGGDYATCKGRHCVKDRAALGEKP